MLGRISINGLKNESPATSQQQGVLPRRLEAGPRTENSALVHRPISDADAATALSSYWQMEALSDYPDVRARLEQHLSEGRRR